MNREELAWAAGLFEGEGCFTMSRSGRVIRKRYAKAELDMVDEEVVRRFHRAVGIGSVGFRGPRAPNRQPMWCWKTHGFQNVQYLLCLLWFGLGARRRQRAAEVLRLTHFHVRVPKTHCPQGHVYTPENTAVHRGKHYCRHCHRNRALAYYYHKKAPAAVP